MVKRSRLHVLDHVYIKKHICTRMRARPVIDPLPWLEIVRVTSASASLCQDLALRVLPLVAVLTIAEVTRFEPIEGRGERGKVSLISLNPLEGL